MASSTQTILEREPEDYARVISQPASSDEPRWYAAYTRANHEKRVAAELHANTVEHFLPVYSSTRRWKDRRVILDLPLFPGYVFVRLALRNRLRVLKISSVVQLVGFSGKPAALPEEEMEILRSSLSQGLRAKPHPFLAAGQCVRIVSGPLQGLEGIVQRKKGRMRFIISLNLILRSVAVEISEADLEPSLRHSLPAC